MFHDHHSNGMRILIPFAVFLVVLGLWTWKLLEASPVPESLTEGWSLDLKFIASKVLHVGVYSCLVLLAAWLPVSRAALWGVIAFLVVHAIATEIGQSFVPNRHGSARDVLLDWFGVAGGLAVLHLIPRLSCGSPSPPE
jgi:hypothetical protein